MSRELTDTIKFLLEGEINNMNLESIAKMFAENPLLYNTVNDMLWIGLGTALGVIGGYGIGPALAAMDRKKPIDVENRSSCSMMTICGVIGAIMAGIVVN